MSGGTGSCMTMLLNALIELIPNDEQLVAAEVPTHPGPVRRWLVVSR